MFKTALDEKMSSLLPPASVLSCMDVHCKEPSHKEDLDQFTLEVLETVQNVAEETLPTPPSGNSQKKNIRPGWREEVKTFRDTAYFWSQIWKSCDKPLNTPVHKIIKKLRNQYHYQYKKCEKSQQKIQKSKLLSACMGGGGDLFKEIKALRKSDPVVATSIDGVTEDVPKYFGTKYSKLYNSSFITLPMTLMR